MSLREAAQQALEALDRVMSHGSAVQEAKEMLRTALAEPEQEPVAWQCSECGGTHLLCPHGRKDVPLYTSIRGKT